MYSYIYIWNMIASYIGENSKYTFVIYFVGGQAICKFTLIYVVLYWYQ